MPRLFLQSPCAAILRKNIAFLKVVDFFPQSGNCNHVKELIERKFIFYYAHQVFKGKILALACGTVGWSIVLVHQKFAVSVPSQGT